MARCAGCGCENIPDARFCRQCGKALDADDDGPITLVPGQTAIPAGAVTGAAPGRTGLLIGLVLTGLAAATAIGYVVGTRSATSLVADSVPAGAASSRPGAAAAEQPAGKPAGERAPPRKTAQPTPARAKPAPSPSSAAEPATAGNADEQQWERMRAELAACGNANLVCHEKVRWRYCKHNWGKVPDCPQASANLPTN